MKVGSLVVCMAAMFKPICKQYNNASNLIKYPVKEGIYTVREIFTHSIHGTTMILLEEIDNSAFAGPPYFADNHEPSFDIICFKEVLPPTDSQAIVDEAIEEFKTLELNNY